jgi:glycyl-tRNA synthetase
MEVGYVDIYEKIVELLKRRGFLWPSFEIYGGLRGFVTYGPLGIELKHRIEEKWREWFIYKQGFVEIESPIIMPEVIFKASGHLDHFTDPVVECLDCKRKFRADHIIEDATGKVAEGLGIEEIEEIIEKENIKCPECGGRLGKVGQFNLMFKTTIGPYSENRGYARPEAAQGMFVEFKRIFTVTREKLPLGIAQIGKVLRNEISPRKGLIRLREFTIMEVEVFVDPEDLSCPKLSEVEDEELKLVTADMRARNEEEPLIVTAREAVDKGYISAEWQAYFMVISKYFISSLGIPWERQRFKEQMPWEKAHYSKQTFDHEIYLQRFGWVEVAGHAYRTDYDLKRHMEHSRVDLTVFKRFKEPQIIEKIVVQPLKEIIKSDFGDNAQKVFSMLKNVNPMDIKVSFDKKGYYEFDGIRIEPKHVKIEKKTEKITGRRFIPHVFEPSFGADRLVYATLECSYSVKENRVVLKLPRDLAPIQVAVFPLVNKDNLPSTAQRVWMSLRDEGIRAMYDNSGSIGRRYARADEVGVPIAVTIDYQTQKDDTVTLRDRDTWQQIRISVHDLTNELLDYFKGRKNFEELGKSSK